MGTGDFTLEFFLLPMYTGASQVLVEIGRAGAGPSTGFQFILNTSSTLIFYYGSTIGNTITGPTLVTSSIWYHIAVSRQSNNLRCFVNGVQMGSTVTDTTDYNQSYLWVGTNAGGGSVIYSGAISNIRVVKGVGVYTSNFSPPNRTLTNTQNANFNGNPSAAISGTATTLLMTMSTSATAFTDSSASNLAISNYFTFWIYSPNPFS